MRKFVPIIVIGLFFGAGWLYFSTRPANNPTPEEKLNTQLTEPGNENELISEFDKSQYSNDDPASIWVVVNKTRPIPLDYIPVGLQKVEVDKRTDKSAEELMMRKDAAKALESLFAKAISEGHPLKMGSAYRSAELQNVYYSNYVSAYGQAEADTFSARPGTSEHQLGISADVSGVDMSCYLETCFGGTPEGLWVAENAHNFGFIIRYPLGKEGITGYQYEPWHLRFVGIELAKEMHRQDQGQTLEEFFEL